MLVRIEDLRIATDELISALITVAEPASPVDISFTVDDGVIVVNATATAFGPAELDPLAKQIVAGTVESFSASVEANRAAVQFRSHPGELLIGG